MKNYVCNMTEQDEAERVCPLTDPNEQAIQNCSECCFSRWSDEEDTNE